MKTIALLVFILLFCFYATTSYAESIKVTPEAITLTITGGETVKKKLGILWDGDVVTAARITTSIQPDSEGFEIKYSVPLWENYFILYPDHHNITLTIITDSALEPGEYTIITTMETLVETQIIIKNETITITDEWLQEKYDELKRSHKDLQSDYSSVLEGMSDREKNIITLFEAITEKDENYSALKKEFQWTQTLLAGGLAFAIFLIMILVVKNRRIKRRYKRSDMPDEQNKASVEESDEDEVDDKEITFIHLDRDDK
jgi:hypothetical protein